MLILTRKIDEEIMIGTDISIRVLSISEGQIKLGITAPANVEIYRGELFLKIKETTIEASEKSKQKVAGLSNLKVNKLNKNTNGAK